MSEQSTKCSSKGKSPQWTQHQCHACTDSYSNPHTTHELCLTCPRNKSAQSTHLLLHNLEIHQRAPNSIPTCDYDPQNLVLDCIEHHRYFDYSVWYSCRQCKVKWSVGIGSTDELCHSCYFRLFLPYYQMWLLNRYSLRWNEVFSGIKITADNHDDE